MDKKRAQALADAYGAGQIKQALIAGEYPPPPVVEPEGTPSGRIRQTKLDFWPLAYTCGPRKLSDSLRERPSAEVAADLAHMDYSALEDRVAAWHADMLKKDEDPKR
jgi:hypothetical protein